MFAASMAITVIGLLPAISGTDADHDVVPDAGPLPPVAAFDQATLITATVSEEVPPRASIEAEVLQVGAVVGVVMLTVGAVVSVVGVVALATLE